MYVQYISYIPKINFERIIIINIIVIVKRLMANAAQVKVRCAAKEQQRKYTMNIYSERTCSRYGSIEKSIDKDH